MLKILRFFECLCYDIGLRIESWADSINENSYENPIHIEQVRAEYGTSSVRLEFPSTIQRGAQFDHNTMRTIIKSILDRQ